MLTFVVHPTKHHCEEHPDILAESSIWTKYCLREEEQLCLTKLTPSANTTSDAMDSYLLHPSLSEERDELRGDKFGCHTQSPSLQINGILQVQQIDGEFIEQAIGNDKSISTFQTDILSSSERETSMDGHADNIDEHLELSLRYENDAAIHHRVIDGSQKNATLEDRDKKRMGFASDDAVVEIGGDLNTLNNWDLQRKERKQAIQKVSMNPTVFKQSTTSLDKKEMRALRNRESAKRSRMKSKQHFQEMERTFVVMYNENKALRLLLEKLLPRCIEKFPNLRENLQTLMDGTS